MRNAVHVIGAGGPAGIGMARCLKEFYDVTGSDSSPWASLMIEVPFGGDGSEMVIPMSDSLVRSMSWGSASSRTFLPPKEQVELCQDKARTAEILGGLAPKTYWIRDTEGAGGKGAQMASEMLPGRNYSVEFVVYEGSKLASFQKERISYSVKERTSGLEDRGSSAVSVCTAVPSVSRRAEEALTRIAEATGTVLHGFYGVDLKCDPQGIPKVTEINAGRLLTASYSFYWLTGYNLPLVGAKAFFGEDPPVLPGYPAGWGIIRQADQKPLLVPPEMTKEWKR